VCAGNKELTRWICSTFPRLRRFRDRLPERWRRLSPAGLPSAAKNRVRDSLRATSQREELYKNFIEEASRLYADALVNDKSEVSKLVDLYALIARMKILSSDAVIEAAEKAGRLILDTYLSPNRTFVDLPDLIKEMDPLHDFSEACRRELQLADRR